MTNQQLKEPRGWCPASCGNRRRSLRLERTLIAATIAILSAFTVLRARSRRRASGSANIDLFSDLNYHEVLSDLHTPCVVLSRRRHQILFARVGLEMCE